MFRATSWASILSGMGFVPTRAPAILDQVGPAIGDEFFTTLRESNFDGLATVCVFGWEETADDIHRRMLERIKTELKV